MLLLSGPVASSMVRSNHCLRRIETYMFLAVSLRKSAFVCEIPLRVASLFNSMFLFCVGRGEQSFVYAIPNRRYEGKALYSLGKLTLYIDRGVVFVNLQGVWKPVSLQDLMIMAK